MAHSTAQQILIKRITAVLSGDAAVDAIWLAGSLGQGGGDAFSDVDMLVLVADGNAPAVAERYAGDLSAIAKTVLVNTIAGRVVNAVTADWDRFDLTFIEPGELDRYDGSKLSPLFNTSGREPPIQDPRVYRTHPQTLNRLVAEFFRVLGLSVVALGREEYLVCLMGTDLLRRMTLDLMLEENGIDPAERGGALRRNPFLTAEQREALEALPVVAAKRESIMAVNTALAEIFLPRAKRLAADIAMDWPHALEDATRRHLHTNLKMTFGA